MEIQSFILIISLICNTISIFFHIKKYNKKIKFEDLTKEEFELKCVELILSGDMNMKNADKIIKSGIFDKDNFKS
ncbi:hypothetical protein [Candidatus Phytoplasma sp. AldY-WA1]|uniref:hypothetical protein n=1 Tax=Candidatus Phytoplasma sp. AldY-WA1 TaxID=2852100 RepID=UPI00254C253D|nr:hypothetical protein [Candidatus Phytoplasma sp. AldY-WA1]